MAIDWHHGTWHRGDRVRFHGNHPNAYLAVEPGLYWYFGMGTGVLFRPDGTMRLNCTPKEAHTESTRLGVTMCYADSFAGRGTVHVGD